MVTPGIPITVPISEYAGFPLILPTLLNIVELLMHSPSTITVCERAAKLRKIMAEAKYKNFIRDLFGVYKGGSKNLAGQYNVRSEIEVCVLSKQVKANCFTK